MAVAEPKHAANGRRGACGRTLLLRITQCSRFYCPEPFLVSDSDGRRPVPALRTHPSVSGGSADDLHAPELALRRSRTGDCLPHSCRPTLVAPLLSVRRRVRSAAGAPLSVGCDARCLALCCRTIRSSPPPAFLSSSSPSSRRSGTKTFSPVLRRLDDTVSSPAILGARLPSSSDGRCRTAFFDGGACGLRPDHRSDAAYSSSVQRWRVMSTHPLARKATPSASSRPRWAPQPGTSLPPLATTRWQGTPAGAQAMARPTRRA